MLRNKLDIKMIKKYFLILFFFLIILTCKTIAQQNYSDIPSSGKSAIFTESFDNNSNNWLIDNLWIKGNVVNGFYDIICKNYQKSTGLSFKKVFIDRTKDYEIETSLNTLKGTAGLAFGITSKYDHYRVDISDNNKLVIIKNTPSLGKNEEIFSADMSSSIKPGSYNKITIRKQNDSFYIFFNETFLGSFNKIKPEGDQVGFNVALNSELSVDYVNVSYLTVPTAPITAVRSATKEEPAPVKSDNAATEIPAVKNVTNTPALNKSTSAKNSTTPIITWISPSGVTTPLDTYTARIKANIKSVSDLKSALFYVNGASKGEGEIRTIPGENGAYIVEKSIMLDPGDNNVYLIATNSEGAIKSDLRYFNNPPANPPVISWGNPVNENIIVSNENFTIEACIGSPTELKSAKILVNGENQGEINVFTLSRNDNCNYKWMRSAILKEGDNSIYLIATNIAGSTTSEKRTIKYQPAAVEKRLALVFGNAVYGTKVSLKNPVNDANLIEATLKGLGFDVIKRINAGISEMKEAVREFGRKLPEYNVALFYYAGHGIQIDGLNYLIPVDAILKDPSDCKYEAIPVDFVTDEFRKYPNNTNIVILDACRNNPFQNWARGGDNGFKAINPTSGTIISFATAAGASAIDGTSANGLFTEELVKQMAVPQPIESVFKKTRIEVKKRSNGEQIPMEWTNLNGDFYFKK